MKKMIWAAIFAGSGFLAFKLFQKYKAQILLQETAAGNTAYDPTRIA